MDPIWIGLPLTLIVHDEQLAEHGGQDGIRDIGGLESALARPRNILACTQSSPSIPELAAAYAVGITQNHPFIDGNKRTALVICFTFLELNGWTITADLQTRYIMFDGLASGRTTPEEFATWLKSSCEPQ